MLVVLLKLVPARDDERFGFCRCFAWIEKSNNNPVGGDTVLDLREEVKGDAI